MKKLSSRTVGELKLMAREMGVDIPDGARKAQVVEAIEANGDQTVITANTVKPSGKPTSGVLPVKEGAIGSAVAEPKPKKEKKEAVKEKVALHSNKNLSWTGVGKLSRGYNFVSKENAEKWLARAKSVRAASPEEVATHYGVE